MRRPLILNGFMATGKSTVGRLIAQRCQVEFVDLDTQIERETSKRISQLFADHGEAHFRALESRALSALLDTGECRVIAVGAGALLARSQRLRALQRAVVLTLHGRLETLLSRAESDDTVRPLLRGGPAQVELLLELRRNCYAEAHARIDVTDITPQQAAARAAELWLRDPISVAAAEHSYSVEVGWSLLTDRVKEASAGASSVLLITDDHVDALYGEQARDALRAAGHRPHTFSMTPGEEHKTATTLQRIWQHCLDSGLDRRSLIIGLGGGVATDVAGFAAASYMRGIPWTSVPTTLLGMVDASVGGKTAIDMPNAKNCVGAFWQPTSVVCDAALLRSEPQRGFRSALAEVVKTALIGDSDLFDLLEAEAPRIAAGLAPSTEKQDHALLTEITRRCVAVKAAVVSQDERESGLRASLNLGHTVGHALEAYGGYGALTHGEAVSLGLVAAMRIGQQLGVTPSELCERVVRLLERLGLPTDLSSHPLTPAAELIANDKKRGGNSVRFVLCPKPGSVVFQSLEVEDLKRRTRALV